MLSSLPTKFPKNTPAKRIRHNHFYEEQTELLFRKYVYHVSAKVRTHNASSTFFHYYTKKGRYVHGNVIPIVVYLSKRYNLWKLCIWKEPEMLGILKTYAEMRNYPRQFCFSPRKACNHRMLPSKVKNEEGSPGVLDFAAIWFDARLKN